MTGKQFILGLGAQKAATSWLYHYMQQDDRVEMGALKEYGALHRRHVSLAESLRQLRHVRTGEAWLRWRMRSAPRFYTGYFAACLRGEGITTTGDITPAYHRLPASVMDDVRKDFAARGIRARAIYLMRDPVARCWSAYRMSRRNHGGADGAFVFRGRTLDFRGYCRDATPAGHSRYHETLARIEQVFAPGDRHVAFFETLFTPSEIGRLSDWLGIASRPDAASQQVNAAGEPSGISDADYAAVAPLFADTYREIGARFPEVRSIWRGFDHVDA